MEESIPPIVAALPVPVIGPRPDVPWRGKGRRAPAGPVAANPAPEGEPAQPPASTPLGRHGDHFTLYL